MTPEERAEDCLDDIHEDVAFHGPHGQPANRAYLDQLRPHVADAIRAAVNDALERAAARYVTEADQTEGVQVYRAGILRRIAAELRDMKEPTP